MQRFEASEPATVIGDFTILSTTHVGGLVGARPYTSNVIASIAKQSQEIVVILEIAMPCRKYPWGAALRPVAIPAITRDSGDCHAALRLAMTVYGRTLVDRVAVCVLKASQVHSWPRAHSRS